MPIDLVAESKGILAGYWSEINSLAMDGQLHDWLDDLSLIEDIRVIVNPKIKTYRYVLPTQLLAKLADGSLDSRCLQVARGGPGAFDARTIAHKELYPLTKQTTMFLAALLSPMSVIL